MQDVGALLRSLCTCLAFDGHGLPVATKRRLSARFELLHMDAKYYASSNCAQPTTPHTARVVGKITSTLLHASAHSRAAAACTHLVHIEDVYKSRVIELVRAADVGQRLKAAPRPFAGIARRRRRCVRATGCPCEFVDASQPARRLRVA